MDKEIWKTIEEFPSYAVSTLGKIKRITKASGTQIGYILKPRIKKDGYYTVSLSMNKKHFTKRVNLLVLEAFTGFRPKNKHTHHKDFNPLNNKLNNLEWITYKEHVKYRRNYKGMNHPGAKLSDFDIKAIRLFYKSHLLTIAQLAQNYNISYQHIRSIILYKSWSHI